MVQFCPLGKQILEKDCHQRHPGIFEILAPNSLQRRVLFLASLAFATLVFRLALYTFRIIFLLACIEDDENVRHRPVHQLQYRDMDDPDDEAAASTEDFGLQDQILRRTAPETQQNARHSSRIARLTAGIFRSTLSILRVLGQLVFSVSRERNIVTKSVRSTYQQLRYESGSMFTAFPGLCAFILSWELGVRIVTALTYIIVVAFIYFVVILLQLVRFGRFKQGAFEPDMFGSHIPAKVAFIIAILFLSPLLTFQTLRTISSSTTLTSNIVTSAFFDPHLFARRYRSSNTVRRLRFNFSVYGKIRRLPHAIFAVFYLVTYFIPYLLVTSVPFNASTYSLWPGATPRFLLQLPGAGSKILFAHLVWIALYAVVLLPSTYFLFRSQVQAMSENEKTVVPTDGLRAHSVNSNHRSNDGNSVRSPLNTCYFPLSNRRFIRLCRILIQISIIALLLFGALFLILWVQIRQLRNSDVLMDWFVRQYLHFRNKVNLQDMVTEPLFWFTT